MRRSQKTNKWRKNHDSILQRINAETIFFPIRVLALDLHGIWIIRKFKPQRTSLLIRAAPACEIRQRRKRRGPFKVLKNLCAYCNRDIIIVMGVQPSWWTTKQFCSVGESMLTLVSSYPQLKLILLVWADILYYNWQAFGLGLFFDCNGWSNRNNMFSWKNLHLRSFSGIYSVERNP